MKATFDLLDESGTIIDTVDAESRGDARRTFAQRNPETRSVRNRSRVVVREHEHEPAAGNMSVCVFCQARIPETTQPQFKVGDRVFSHYEMKWGTIARVGNTDRGRTHGVTGSKLPDTTWYDVTFDDGATSLLDDAHGDWDMARIVPPAIARRYGYGSDPKS